MFPSPSTLKDPASRRIFIETIAQLTLGVSVYGLAGPGTALAAKPAVGGGKAKSLIYIYVDGGLSHVDSFDPKKSKDIMGPTTVIDTKVDTIKLGHYFEKLATQADQIALVRSLTTTNGAHEPGRYIMRTGYSQRNTIVHPTVGPFVTKLLGKRGEVLPDSVVVGQATSNSGFLDPSLAPVPIADPSGGLPNAKLLTDADQFARRMQIASQLGQKFADRFKYARAKSYVSYYEQANKLLNSSDLQVFDISAEGDAAREAYGSSTAGQGCLLARRLVEAGVRVVEVVTSGWDMHVGLQEGLDEKGPMLDQAIAALIADLKQRGLLESTLIAVGTEFGRTPKMNVNGGRDHHPRCYSGLFAGGGVAGGRVHGETDGQGEKVKTDPVKPEDFIATMGFALGVPLDQEVYSPSKRPFKFGNGGTPLADLFA